MGWESGAVSEAAERPDPGPAGSAPEETPGATASRHRGASTSGARRPRSGAALLLSLGAGVLAVDVVSKLAVVALLSGRPPVRLLGGALYLTEARNAGAAFSFAPEATVVFTVIAMAVIALVIRSATRVGSTGWAVSLGLILGGAAGNLTDRLLRSPGPLRGAVIDFLSVFDPHGRAWPIFNLADSAIVCGGVLAVLLAFRGVDLSGASGAVRAGRRK